MKIALLFFFTLINTLSIAQQWEVTNIPPNSSGQRFDDVFFLNEYEGWAANGFFAAVYKTGDGGVNWTEVLNESELEGDHYFRNIIFLDNQIGFLGTLNGKFYKTSNGGGAWEEIIITPNPPAICGFDVVGDDIIFGCGAYFGPAYIIKSSDRGESWDYRDMSGLANALVEIKFINEQLGFAAGSSESGACILKTRDGGETWTEIFNSGIAGQYVWKLQILDTDPMLIFGAVESFSPHPGKLLKSSDLGDTWISHNAPETGIQAVGFISSERGWMGGHSTGLFETNDGGQTWTNLGIGSNLNRIFRVNESTLFAAGTSIYKFSDQSLGLDGHEMEGAQRLTVKIQPNPVGDELRIKIEFPSRDNVVVQLYSVKGQLIRQLFRDQIHHPQTKEFVQNVSTLPSGIYFLNIHNNNNRFSVPFIKH